MKRVGKERGTCLAAIAGVFVVVGEGVWNAKAMEKIADFKRLR